MPENDRLNGCLNEAELGVVEREAIPKLLMKLGIQLHLAAYRFRIPFLFLKYRRQSCLIYHSRLGPQSRATAQS